MTTPTLAPSLIASAVHYLALGPPRIERALQHLTEDEIWQSPSPTLVSPGNLILHLCGNVTQYVLAGLGGRPDERQRDNEFSDQPDVSKDRLVGLLHETVDDACAVIGALTEEQLTRTYRVQGCDTTGVDIVVHVTEHFSYHVGQIVWHAKALKGVDLGFYAGRNLNAKNG